MKPARLPAMMLLAAVGGCVPAVRGVAVRHDPLAQQMIALAAARIQRCYGTPRVPHAARQIGEVAKRAVLRCAPLRLPAELYEGGWEDLELVFTPGQMR